MKRKNGGKTIIIGGGPGGASAAIYLKRFNHSVLLLDAPQKVPGRTAQALQLENVLGFSKPTPGPEFLSQISRQLKRFNIDTRQELVTHVTRRSDGYFYVTTEKPEIYKADYVIISVGVFDILPDIPAVEDYFGKTLFQCPTCNWFQTKDKVTGIISNDDTGITSALAFNAMQKGSCLFVVPDRPRNYFSLEMIEKAKNKHIAVYKSPIVCFNGAKGRLRSIQLANETEIDVEILYTKLGVKRHDTFLDLKSVNVDRNEEGYISVDFETMETSVKNVFAVGPCNSGPDQVIVAAGQGATAAMAIHGRILTKLGI